MTAPGNVIETAELEVVQELLRDLGARELLAAHVDAAGDVELVPFPHDAQQVSARHPPHMFVPGELGERHGIDVIWPDEPFLAS